MLLSIKHLFFPKGQEINDGLTTKSVTKSLTFEVAQHLTGSSTAVAKESKQRLFATAVQNLWLASNTFVLTFKDRKHLLFVSLNRKRLLSRRRPVLPAPLNILMAVGLMFGLKTTNTQNVIVATVVCFIP